MNWPFIKRKMGEIGGIIVTIIDLINVLMSFLILQIFYHLYIINTQSLHLLLTQIQNMFYGNLLDQIQKPSLHRT